MPNFSRHFTSALMIGASAVVSYPAAVCAQTAQASDGSATIEDIVVTAQKREQNLRDVPISITAISGDQMTARGNFSFYDLNKVAPGVNFIPTADNLHSKNSIRGVSSYANDIGQQSPIGIFIDGVFMARTAIGTSQDFADLDRIEILRGPQGTLFGMNTSTGLIHFITKKPNLKDVAGNVEVAYGTKNTFNVRGNVSAPLVQDKVAISLSGYHDYHGGYEYNVVQNKKTDNLDKNGVKGKLRLATDGFDGVITVDYENEHSKCCEALIATVLPGATSQGVATASLAPTGYPFSRLTIQNVSNTNPSHQYGAMADWVLDVGNMRLTSVTAYRYWTGAPLNDVDGISRHLIDNYLLDQTHKQFSQEVRLTSPAGKPLEYILGAFYYHRDSRDHEFLSLGSDVPAGFKVPNTDASTTNDSHIKDTTYAAFAHVDVHVQDSLTLSGGIRYTIEPQKAVFNQTSFNFAYPNLGGFSASRRDKKFTWTASATYKLGPKTTVYATAASGFTPGGFDVLQRQNFIGFSFKPETNLNLEAGIKSTLLDGRATISFDGFRMRYTDFQTQAFNGLNLTTSNAGSFVSQGFELETEFKPSRELTLAANGSYIDAHYTDFADGQCPLGVAGAFCNLTGFRLFNAPKWTANASADYQTPVTSKWDVFLRANVAYKSAVFYSQNLNPYTRQGGYAVVDGGFGFKSKSGITVEALAKNIFNRNYLTQINPAALSTGLYVGYAGAPRILELRLSKQF